MHTIAIFRHQLFKVSEPFITSQAQQIERFSVLYLGRERFGAAPDGAESVAVSDLPEYRNLRARVWQVLSRDPRPYLRLLGTRRPALIHAHFGVEGVYALPIARRLGIPLVTTFHGYDATQTSPALLRSGHPSWWNYVLHRRELAAQGTLFVCVSEFIRRRVMALGFPETRTRIHYTGVDTAAIRPQPERFASPTILHVARLVEVKGTSDLIVAFTKVARKIPEAELLIVGEGPLEVALRRQAEELGVAAAVYFLGARPRAEVLALMARAWVFALPSAKTRDGATEGLGMVLLEAAASGVPAVATRHGGIPEAVIDGETGCLCAEHDVDALAAALTELLRNDALRSRMGSAARAHVERHFDLKRQCAALERIYTNLLGEKPAVKAAHDLPPPG